MAYKGVKLIYWLTNAQIILVNLAQKYEKNPENFRVIS